MPNTLKVMLHPDIIVIFIAFIVTTSTFVLVYVMRVRKVEQKVEERPAPSSNTVKNTFPEVKLKNAEELRAAILEFKGRKSSEIEELFERLNTAKESIKKLMEELDDANR
ncbi:MAG: hypothetical protein LZ159_03065 [Thaumarchaeota archaeon]|nr:hypothetical protein [Candidatus Terraquivivens yellowstonensis]